MMDRLDDQGRRARMARPSRPFRGGHKMLWILLILLRLLLLDMLLTEIIGVKRPLLFDCFGYHFERFGFG